MTLKIDVSYTDHSHIIGRGGNTIKAVMTKTGCHIHFPDCNRSNQFEKSNMVSISGESDRVELARSRVRVSQLPVYMDSGVVRPLNWGPGRVFLAHFL